jgi:maleylacetate reductase
MGLQHKLAHVVAGKYQLPHAGVHSALLPHVAAFNAAAVPVPFARAVRAMGLGGPDEVGAAMFELATQLHAPTSLAELGLDDDAIPGVAKIIGASPVPNPRDYTEEQVVVLLEQAYLGTKPQRLMAPFDKLRAQKRERN